MNACPSNKRTATKVSFAHHLAFAAKLTSGYYESHQSFRRSLIFKLVCQSVVRIIDGQTAKVCRRIFQCDRRSTAKIHASPLPPAFSLRQCRYGVMHCNAAPTFEKRGRLIIDNTQIVSISATIQIEILQCKRVWGRFLKHSMTAYQPAVSRVAITAFFRHIKGNQIKGLPDDRKSCTKRI